MTKTTDTFGPLCIYADDVITCEKPATIAGYCVTHAPQGSDRAQALAAAIAPLGAVEVAPDYYTTENLLGIGWWIYKRERLEALATDILTPNVLYWPALNAKKMPAWWSPERRWFYRCKGCSLVIHQDGNSRGTPGAKPCETHDMERITADLETGEEVPCA